MTTKVSVPPPTQEENALRTEQTELLRSQREILLQQQQQQKMLMPIFAKQLGLDMKFDAQGNIVSASAIDDPEAKRIQDMQKQVLEKTLADYLNPDPLDPQRQNVEKLLLDRSEKALKGELPVDPALERNIKEQREVLTGRLRDQFGAGYDTSTPGIEALQKFEESSEVLRDQARRGDLTLAEQLSLSREQVGTQTRQNEASMAFNIGQGDLQGAMAQRQQLQQILGAPMAIAGGFGQTSAGFQMPIGQLMQQRQMELDARVTNANNKAQGLGAIGGIFGSVLGAMPWSDRRLKHSLGIIGQMLGIPIYVYTLFTGRTTIGLMAQDLVEIRPDLVGSRNGFMTVNYRGL